MMDCNVCRDENASATDEELMASLIRRAKRVAKTAEIPTLHRALTTANELRKHCSEMTVPMAVDKVEPTVLEEFLWQSKAKVRAVNAIGWLCNNLRLGWPIDEFERPDAKKTSLIGMGCKQAPTAQPGMLKALEEALEAAAESRDPTWLALLASWLQANGIGKLAPS